MSFSPVRPRPFGSVASCVAELFKQAGGIKRVVFRLGIKQSVAYGYTEENTDAELSLKRAAQLSDPTCTAVAEFFASLCGGAFLPLDSESEGNELVLTAQTSRANGEAVAAIIDALRDGTITAAEAENALPLLDAAQKGLAALRGRLMKALEAGRS